MFGGKGLLCDRERCRNFTAYFYYRERDLGNFKLQNWYCLETRAFLATQKILYNTRERPHRSAPHRTAYIRKVNPVTECNPGLQVKPDGSMDRSLVVKLFSVFSKLGFSFSEVSTGNSGQPRSVCVAIFKGRGPFRGTFPVWGKSLEQVHRRVSGESLSLTWRDQLSLSCFYAWGERHIFGQHSESHRSKYYVSSLCVFFFFFFFFFFCLNRTTTNRLALFSLETVRNWPTDTVIVTGPKTFPVFRFVFSTFVVGFFILFLHLL